MKYLLLILLISCANHRSMECLNDNIGNCILSLNDSCEVSYQVEKISDKIIYFDCILEAKGANDD